MDSRVEGPRFLRADEFDEAIDLVRRCFGMETDGEQRPPHWADPAEPDRHAVVTVDGTVVSHAVCMPIEFAAGPATVPARGIAGVATDPDHRGNGYMTALIEFWIDRAEQGGVPLLELEGDRQRYMRFGWDNAGREFRFAVTTRSHPAPGSGDDAIRPFRGDRSDLELIARLHDAERYRVVRDRDRYARVLDPHRYRTLLYEGDDGAAYVSFRGEDTASVAEFGGSEAGVAALLGHLCEEFDEIEAYTHPHHPLVDLFYRVGADWTLRSHRKLRVTNLFDLIGAYRPLLRDRWMTTNRGGPAEITLAIADQPGVRLRFADADVTVERANGDVDVELDRPAMTRLLFGVPDGMWSVKREHPLLTQLLPLEYYMWQTETI